MISGINHITLSVRNLDESFDFYTQVLNFRPLAKWNKGAYLLAGDLWVCLIHDLNTRSAPLLEYSHISFNVNKESFRHIEQQIITAKATLWKENTSEGDSLYLLDPNGHKLEIHSTTWKDRIEACKKAPYSGMVFYESN